ncbi:sensor histidine kinase [Sphingomonas hankyongi]|uniref:Histidine kinase n=1 Tax=Sphingomonas hankyongi TaxID=2908209 RepID=A0ABT0S1U5_9SPHN|nr:histidine kinase [Sphingomonas hankyongi]MCL6729530.1 histidine kinase [Sphingomonas hankyongi]
MRMLPHPTVVEHRLNDWPLAVKSIFGMWFVYYLTVVARAFLTEDPWTIMANRLLTVSIGVALTAGIYVVFALYARDTKIKQRIVIGGVASFVAAAAQAGLLIAADRFLEKPQEEMRFISREGYSIVETGNTMRLERPGQAPLVVTWPRLNQLHGSDQFRYAADSTVTWFFFFAAWTAFYMAMLAQAEALRVERRLAVAENAAQVAQVRALRYQVNPHFLFNTLNSLSSLVMTGRTDRAETMLLALSTFFRTSLSLDPTAEVTLAEEIDLQRLYLDIEKARFPDRLHVDIRVPEGLEQARLPALILQPIVENAIKYGVSKSRKAVLIEIEARHLGDGRMVVEISNRLKNGGEIDLPTATHEGTGVGLANVCQRLEARFGNRASCRYGPIAGGGFKVSLTTPVETHAP